MTTEFARPPIPETLASLGTRGADLFKDRPALRWREPDGTWAEASYVDMGQASDEIASGLIGLGLAAGDRIVTQTKLRPEWTYTLLATAASGLVLTNLLPTTVPDEIVHVVNDSGAKVLICEDSDQLAKVRIAQPLLPDLARIIVIDPDEATDDVMSLADLRELGRRADPAELARRRSCVEPDDLLVLLYTSGTTGSTKGCPLTHRNYVSAIRSQREAKVGAGYGTLYSTSATSTVTLITQTMALSSGLPVAFRKGTDTDAVLTELLEVGPAYVLLAPMLLEGIYAAALEKLPARLRRRALGTARLGSRVRDMLDRGEEIAPELRQRFDEAERLVFEPVRALFGGALDRLQVSGAPISSEILEFFAGCGLTVLQGYALSETAGVGVVNRPTSNRLGTVGKPVPGVDVRVADDGEILVRGENVFAGYWGRAAVEGAGTLRDGWLHTGDNGSFDEDGFLTITGRTKDIIKLNNAFGVPPSVLESIARECPLISQFVLYGEGKPYLVALVTLDERHAGRWAADRALPTEVPKLIQRREFLDHLDGEIDRANARVQDYYQAKAYLVLERDLSVKTGEVTGTQKVCRPVVHKHFGARLEGLYL